MAPLRQPRVAVSRASGMVGKNIRCTRWDTPPYSPKALAHSPCLQAQGLLFASRYS